MSKIQTKDVIKYSAYITANEGYVKRSSNPNVACTADKVIDAIEYNSISDDELEEVKDRIAKWFDYINDQNQSGEYFDNLREEVVKPSIDEIKVGLIASSFASFDKYLQFKANNELDKQSEFLGEEGDKITFNIINSRLVKTGVSKYNNSNGKWYLYRITAECKNGLRGIVTWFADRDCSEEFSKCNIASATVSKLSTFNEVKQTNVSKLRFL